MVVTPFEIDLLPVMIVSLPNISEMRLAVCEAEGANAENMKIIQLLSIVIARCSSYLVRSWLALHALTGLQLLTVKVGRMEYCGGKVGG